MLELKKPVAITRPSSTPFENRPEREVESRVPLRDYWGSIRKHWWLVSGLTVLVTAIAAIYLVRKPDIYESQALVMVDLEELNPVQGAASKNPVIVNSTVNDPAYFNTQLRILTSQGLLRRVVKTLDLEHNATFPRPSSMPERQKWWANLQRMFGTASPVNTKVEAKDNNLEKTLSSNEDVPTNSQVEATEAKRLAPLVKDITDELRVEPVVEKRLGYSRDNTRLIEIQFQHHDPEIAAKVVNGIADSFVLLNLERRAETNVTTGDFLQKRIAELQAQIRNGEERLMNYARSHQILSLNADQNMVVERLTGLNKQLLEAENKRKVAEAAYRAALAPGAASALAEENTARKIVDIETKLAELRQRRAQLLVENTEEWPEVKEVNQQIAALEEEVRNARGRSATVLVTNHETQYRQALTAEQSLRKAFDQQRSDTLTQNEAAINYRIIQQEIETNKNLLDGLLSRYKENDVVLAGMRKNIHVIDYAIPADKAVGPRRWQGIMLVLCFSLAMSIGLAFLLEYLNDTINSSDEAEKMLQLPALVTIPISTELKNRQFQPHKLFTTESHSALAESYRQLRTSVLLSTAGQPPKTLLVTSSMPGEGKTTTAVNLAFCLAQIGARVLIIDADLRRPRLHSVFGIPHQQGLSTCLVKGLSETQTLGLIRRYSDSRLHLLTAGPVPPNPAELLGSEQMRKLITMLERHYTHIIIDSPPSASFTDATLLSSLADGILMVVQSGKTQYKVVRHSINLLTGAGARIFGVVLNQASNRQDDHYYQGYYQQPVEQIDESKIFEAEIVEATEESIAKELGLDDFTAKVDNATNAFADSTNADSETTEATEAESILSEEKIDFSGDLDTDEERFRTLCAAFDHPSQTVREDAIHALYQLGENQVTVFTRAMREAPFARSRRIGAAIASSGLADDAINHLTSGNEKYYDALSLLLMMMKAGEAKPLLRAIKTHTNNEIRIAAISLLALSQQKEYLTELRHLAFHVSLPSEVQSALLAALHLPTTTPLKKSSDDRAKETGR
ncbi:MAG: polysaccharide biosynthesis tyrosine autokinase [Acidobacteria bacterium]|nr:polysaccharide biosynthesis tyrosine autokinase [Acidobacteriota bacterium]